MEIRPILSSLLRSKTGPVLVALQVAISLAILANALHIVSVRQADAARPSGIANESEVFSIFVRNLVSTTPNDQMAIQKRDIATLRAVSGVVSAAYTSQSPMSRSGSTNSVSIDRKQVNQTTSAAFYTSPDSLIKTWGMKLVEGRDFRPEEIMEVDQNTSDAQARIVIITKPLADKMWPGASSAIGKTMYFGVGENASEARVIGVVERLQSTGAQVTERGEHSTIVPMRFIGRPGAMYTVRAEPGQRDRVMKEAEAALRATSSTSVILRTKTVDEDRKERYRADVAMSWMLVTVSVLLLLITASGIVGMASLWVQQRRKQIGVRRALGARRIDILRYFLTENFMITSVGVVAGVLLGIGLNQLLVSKLEMTKLPLEYLFIGGGVFWALGVFAAYGPAWRAASISPATATRSA
jgi:putative ABC transport system permease protein